MINSIVSSTVADMKKSAAPFATPLPISQILTAKKETIERIFGTAKENHGFRYTQLYGKARMTMKVALTFACMNLKKLAKCKQEWGLRMA